jgi:hypothetical protein
MNCRRVPAELYTVVADNGDLLMLYGKDEAGNVMLWPTKNLCKHPIAFGRFCRRNIESMRGLSLTLNHPISLKVIRWARWLGVTFEEGVARV